MGVGGEAKQESSYPTPPGSIRKEPGTTMKPSRAISPRPDCSSARWRLFPPGPGVQVRLTLPDGRALDLAGTIMWARKTAPQLAESMKSGMGVRLDQAGSAYAAYLAFVKSVGA